MLLPSGKVVTVNTPIYPNSNFTWGEATRNCTRQLQDLVVRGKLLATARQIEQDIVRTAMKLDDIRSELGNRPILINSWYRPARVNRSVGGSEYSRHQYGDAVDIRSNYFNPRSIYSKIEPNHDYGGIARYANFVHLDWRGNRARW